MTQEELTDFCYNLLKTDPSISPIAQLENGCRDLPGEQKTKIIDVFQAMIQSSDYSIPWVESYLLPELPFEFLRSSLLSGRFSTGCRKILSYLKLRDDLKAKKVDQKTFFFLLISHFDLPIAIVLRALKTESLLAEFASLSEELYKQVCNGHSLASVLSQHEDLVGVNAATRMKQAEESGEIQMSLLIEEKLYTGIDPGFALEILARDTSWEIVTLDENRIIIQLKDKEGELKEFPFGLENHRDTIHALEIICAEELLCRFDGLEALLRRMWRNHVLLAIHPEVFGKPWVRLINRSRFEDFVHPDLPS
jgi:hypothetical protein